MGYVSMVGACYCCGRPFTFNPLRVPSVRDPSTNKREPICLNCIVPINEKRVANGLEPAVIHSDAYDAVDEHEVSWGNA